MSHRGLGVLPLDRMTFPTADVRQKVIDLTRQLAARKTTETVRLLLKSGCALRE